MRSRTVDESWTFPGFEDEQHDRLTAVALPLFGNAEVFLGVAGTAAQDEKRSSARQAPRDARFAMAKQKSVLRLARRSSSIPVVRFAIARTLAVLRKAAVTGTRDTGRVMSEESTTADVVQLTRRALEGSNPRDFDAMMSFYAPDAVWDMSQLGMGVFEGVAAIRGFYEDWIGAYDDYRIAVEEIVDLGNGIVFSKLSQQARPAGSESVARMSYACVTAAVDGRLVRVTNYSDIDEARADAESLARERG
jgi:ketosteroid isomerase-like protein